MKPFFILLCFSVILLGCSSAKSKNDIGTIEDLMARQQKAWNTGSLEGFMQAYWRSDSLVFVGKKGLQHGWDSTLSNYQRSYPSQQEMGRLQFNNLKHECLGEQAIYTIGKWSLFRQTDTLSGHYSLLWRKVNGTWVIVADHSS